jgi:hypothetical protein
VPSRIDLGDFPPISYLDELTPGGPRTILGEAVDLRLPAAWETPNNEGLPTHIDGHLIKVGIVDDGIQSEKLPQFIGHPDLKNALDTQVSHHHNFFYLENDPRSDTSEPVDRASDTHGTSLAGIVGAREQAVGINTGIAGVASGVTLQGVVALKGFVDDVDWAWAFAWGTNKLKDTDGDNSLLDEERGGNMFCDVCLNASFPSGSVDAIDLYKEDWLWKRAIQYGSTRGRFTLGVPYVTSAGNGGWGHMNTNYMEQKNSIFQIVVAGVSDLGRRIAYSNRGSNITCAAPTWGDELPPLLDWSSRPPAAIFGATRPIKKNPPIEVDDVPYILRRGTQGAPTIRTFVTAGQNDYDFNFIGTSASAAQVAGIVALLLDLRSDLSARDVKEILLRSSRVCNDCRVTYDDPPKIWPTQWRMAAIWPPHALCLRAGLIDANRAIQIAKQWPKLPMNPCPAEAERGRPTFGKLIKQADDRNRRRLFPAGVRRSDSGDGLPYRGHRSRHHPAV